MYNWRIFDIVFSKLSLSKASVITVSSFCILCSLKAYSAPIPEKAMVFFWAKDIEKQGANDRRPLGSGFLVNNEGVILTAKHVIEYRRPGERIIASISGKSTFPVPIDETDIHCAMANRDVCTVRIPPDAIPTSVTSFFKPECGKLETMTKLHAMGFTGGADRFGGVIRPSGEVIGRAVTGGLIPTDLDLVPTMSGGPVLNSRNNVVALVKGADSTSHNLTFVTPITSVRSILMNLNVQCIVVSENSGENMLPKTEEPKHSISFKGHIWGTGKKRLYKTGHFKVSQPRDSGTCSRSIRNRPVRRCPTIDNQSMTIQRVWQDNYIGNDAVVTQLATDNNSCVTAFITSIDAGRGTFGACRGRTWLDSLDIFYQGYSDFNGAVTPKHTVNGEVLLDENNSTTFSTSYPLVSIGQFSGLIWSFEIEVREKRNGKDVKSFSMNSNTPQFRDYRASISNGQLLIIKNR